MEDDSLNFVGRVAQKAIIEHGGKILLLRNHGRQTWELPGGRLHAGEEPRAGLARELKEELSVDVSVGAPIDIGTFVLKKTNEPHFVVVYAATLTDDHAELVMPPDEVEEIRWVGKEEIEVLDIWDDYRNALQRFLQI
ncbi:MAG: 8-oxo-dGTP diphosphatase [Patescibacteria group bacterium]|jgi:8-oxo-dGTP diphosphatase|nr:8-oxo-dGTP diphosphatase [Patescibacteria group bacterium]